MNEREFQNWVLDTARRLGWVAWHVPMPMQPIPGGKFVPSKRGKGLSDLILFHERAPALIFAECKGPDGKVTDEQREFLRLVNVLRDSFGQHVQAVQDAFKVYRVGVELPAEITHWRIPIAGYSWRPGQEDAIEMILRSKVLV